MKMRMLKHCTYCGKLQMMRFDERKTYDAHHHLVSLTYTYKCKKCNHFNMMYKEV